MKSNLISKTETVNLLRTVSNMWGMELARTRNMKIYHISDNAQIATGGGLKILRINDDYVPFLSETGLLGRFPSVVVDMGAVRFVCKGANVMRPGIKRISEFERGDIVCVAEESRNKFLAVGRSLVSSSDAEGMERGEVVKSIHYVSDRFWEIGKTIRD